MTTIDSLTMVPPLLSMIGRHSHRLETNDFSQEILAYSVNLCLALQYTISFADSILLYNETILLPYKFGIILSYQDIFSSGKKFLLLSNLIHYLIYLITGYLSCRVLESQPR